MSLSLQRLVFSFAALYALVCLACCASAEAQPIEASTQNASKRANHYSIQVWNNCDEAVRPKFKPALPGHNSTAWPVIQPGKNAVHRFTASSYKGVVYAPIKGSHSRGMAKTTKGEIDVENGMYDISLANGFNIPMALQLQGRQLDGQCDMAQCKNKHCKDAYQAHSGLVRGTRKGSPTEKPNHACPADFTNWVVFLC